MPLEASVFPEEVQLAFFIFQKLTDRWDTNTGTYFGKNWSDIKYLFELYEIEDEKEVYFFARAYETYVVKASSEEQKRRQKREEQKGGSSGKTYTHNVRG